MTEAIAQPSRRAFHHAETDITWFFTVAPSLLDLRSASMEPGPSVVWDDARLWDLHEARVAVMKAASRARSIEMRLAQIDGWNRQVARARFDSYGALRLITASAFAYKGLPGSFLGIALLLPETSDAYAAEADKHESVIAMLTTWATQQNGRVTKLRERAVDEWRAAVSAFAWTRVMR